jgi:hypothetical protein
MANWVADIELCKRIVKCQEKTFDIQKAKEGTDV